MIARVIKNRIHKKMRQLSIKAYISRIEPFKKLIITSISNLLGSDKIFWATLKKEVSDTFEDSITDKELTSDWKMKDHCYPFEIIQRLQELIGFSLSENVITRFQENGPLFSFDIHSLEPVVSVMNFVTEIAALELSFKARKESVPSKKVRIFKSAFQLFENSTRSSLGYYNVYENWAISCFQFAKSFQRNDNQVAINYLLESEKIFHV